MDNNVDVVEVTYCNSRSVVGTYSYDDQSMVRDYHNQHRIVKEGGWNIADAVQNLPDVEICHDRWHCCSGRIGLYPMV